MNERGGEGFLTHAAEERLRAKLTAAEQGQEEAKRHAAAFGELLQTRNADFDRAEQELDEWRERTRKGNLDLEQAEQLLEHYAEELHWIGEHPEAPADLLSQRARKALSPPSPTQRGEGK